jgi:hypothetical protein
MTSVGPDFSLESADTAQRLLKQFQPVVRFDSHEAFFPDDVAAMADNRNFRLVRKTVAGALPGVIATHYDDRGGLSLGFLTLDGGKYPNGEPFTEGDHFGLDLRGPDAFADKIGDYRQMEQQLDAGLRDRVYGHAVTHDGDLWLQYWYFYLYNDAQFGGRVDLHEGDWEMVQFLIREGRPVSAVYAQHAYAELKPWSEVEQDPELECPIVYSGRGSHASYFEAGLHQTHVDLNGDFIPLWWDVVDAAGSQRRQELVILEDPLPGWSLWRGSWGGTQPHVPFIDGESPGGPVTHPQWRDPMALERRAIGHRKGSLRVAQPVSVRRSPPGLAVRFSFNDTADPPDRLLITTRANREPPITETIVVDSITRGRVVTRQPLDPEQPYTVDVSTISSDGIPTSPPPGSTIKLAALGPVSPIRILAGLLWQTDRFWMWVGTRLTRRVARESAIVQRTSAMGRGLPGGGDRDTETPAPELVD